jgi:hypothetical protein
MVRATPEAEPVAGEFAIAVIVPAATCPCLQVEAVRPQVRSDGCLIVVWNGPRSESHDCASQVLLSGAAVWLEFGDRLGAATARNWGANWLDSRAKVLAFADADDVAHADWLAHLREPLAAGRADLAEGPLELTVRGRTYTVEPGRDFWHRQALYGSNCAVTREAWARLGGFRTGVGTCEDTDHAWRAGELGLRIELVKSAVMRYTLRRGWAELRQRLTWGRSSVALLHAHDLPLSRHLPGLRGLVEHKRSHGFASNPHIAGTGQYVGQWAGRILDRAGGHLLTGANSDSDR